MDKITDYPAYFRQIATENIAISHTVAKPKFGRLEFDEDLISVKKGGISTQTPCLFVGFPRANVIDLLSDNTHNHTQVVMMIVKNCKADDFLGIDAAIKECEAIGYQILGRLYNDYTKAKLQGFDRNSIVISEVMRKPDLQDYGILFEFVLHRSISPEIYYKPEQWNV